MVYDVIIVGAGVAALFAAANLKKGLNVLLLEKMESPAKKLLISGSGRCNYTHSGEISSFIGKYGYAGNFLKHSLYSFTNINLIDYFSSKGMKSIIEENGKVFPEGKASTILGILKNEIKKNGFQIKCSSPVNDILNQEYFEIVTSGFSLKSKFVLIATGGKSFPSTGSTGDGYVFAKKLGHNIEEPKPALTSLYSDKFGFLSLSGNSIKNAQIKIRDKNGKKLYFTGELLITHKGVSGPLILDASRYINENDEILINLTGFVSVDDFFCHIKKIFSNNSKKNVSNVQFIPDLSDALREKILDVAGISFNSKCDSFSDKKISFLCEKAMNLPFKVSSKGDFNVAMVTAGGVSRNEINSKTMESRIVNNLFFAGEVIDIDGDTGGYNIQAACSTAFSAVSEINRRASFS